MPGKRFPSGYEKLPPLELDFSEHNITKNRSIIGQLLFIGDAKCATNYVRRGTGRQTTRDTSRPVMGNVDPKWLAKDAEMHVATCNGINTTARSRTLTCNGYILQLIKVGSEDGTISQEHWVSIKWTFLMSQSHTVIIQPSLSPPASSRIGPV